MPTISIFYGIVIQMFWQDHAPPHFDEMHPCISRCGRTPCVQIRSRRICHALYAEHEALIEIRNLRVIQGHLPKRALALVLEWASKHGAELLEDWELCTRMQTPNKIEPLK